MVWRAHFPFTCLSDNPDNLKYLRKCVCCLEWAFLGSYSQQHKEFPLGCRMQAEIVLSQSLGLPWEPPLVTAKHRFKFMLPAPFPEGISFFSPDEGIRVCILPSAAVQVPGHVSGRAGESGRGSGLQEGAEQTLAHEGVIHPSQDSSAAGWWWLRANTQCRASCSVLSASVQVPFSESPPCGVSLLEGPRGGRDRKGRQHAGQDWGPFCQGESSTVAHTGAGWATTSWSQNPDFWCWLSAAALELWLFAGSI